MIRHHFKVLESTNDWGKHHIMEWDKKSITLITTDEQTAGRGRFGRRWYSPPGENLNATYIFFLEETKIEITPLVQLLAFSASKVLEDNGFSPAIKWPNDLLLSSKKVAGILCETVPISTPSSSLVGIVIGIGLNVNMSAAIASKIDQPATSLLIESGKIWDIEEIIQALSKQVELNLQSILATQACK